MILSDSRILERINKGDIKINPFNIKNLGSNSYDVHLSNTILTYDDMVLNPKEDLKVSEIKIKDNGFLLLPNKIYLGCTIEHFETKLDLLMFDGINSLARLGLRTQLTSLTNFGFKGSLTLQLSCVMPIIIYPNMNIGQVYYNRIEGMVINPNNKHSKYENQFNKPIKSKMFENFDNDSKINNFDFKSRVCDSGISFDPEKQY